MVLLGRQSDPSSVSEIENQRIPHIMAYCKMQYAVLTITRYIW